MNNKPPNNNQDYWEAPDSRNLMIRLFERIQPRTSTGIGAVLGAVTATELFILWYIFYLPTGWSFLVYLLAIPAVLLITYTIIAAAALGATMNKKFSFPVTGIVTGSFAAFILVSSMILGLALLWAVVFAILLIPLLTLLGAALGCILQEGFEREGIVKKTAAKAFLLLMASLSLLLVFWLFGSGSDDHLVPIEITDFSGIQNLTLSDPSQTGSFEVRTFFYGSGTDRHRGEYGAAHGSGVEMVTQSVNAEPLLPEISAVRRKLRENFWGFDLSHIPLNGLAWYPDGQGPFPLVVLVHGNHPREIFSEKGYAYLGEMLASRGFIVTAVDQNFLNSSWRGGDFSDGAVPARAWLVLKHLELWQNWNETPGNRFYNKVDFDNIALIGHSRGGEAVAAASVFNNLPHLPEDETVDFDFGFNIQSVAAVAPSVHFYRPVTGPLVIEDTDYLVIQGGHDGDLQTFMGLQQYGRVVFSEEHEKYRFKSALYIYTANHGHFNSRWGRRDLSLPYGLLLNLKPVMDEAAQQRTARVYLSAFLEATLKDEKGYLPMFRDHRYASEWLPVDYYLNRFEDSTLHMVCNYQEDKDRTTTTAAGGSIIGENLTSWREEELPLRLGLFSQHNRAVVLEWNRDQTAAPPVYSITLPEGQARMWQLNESFHLVFALTQLEGEEEPLDFTIELVGEEGEMVHLPMSRFAAVPPPLTVKTTELGPLERLLFRSSEPFLQTYEIPLSAFIKVSSGFDPENLQMIRFIFDKSTEGSIALDEIGFRP